MNAPLVYCQFHGISAPRAHGTGRRFLLAEGEGAPGRVRFLGLQVEPAEGATQSWVTVTRTGSFTDPRYARFEIFNRFDRKTRKEKPPTEWVRVPAHEAIVAPELFEKVQAAMGERAPKAEQGSSTSQHVFTGLLRCGRCDGALKIRTGKGSGGVMYSYYGCHNHLQGVRCGLPAFRADQFDSWMTQQLLDRVLTVDVIQGVLDRLDEAASDWVNDRSRRRTALLLELRAAEGRRRKLFEVIEEGGKDAPGIKELGPRLRELNAQIENLERAMVALEAEPEPNVGPLTITAEEAAEIFRSTITASDDPRKRRAVLATITDRIVVNDGSVDVHYKQDRLVSADGLPVRSEHCWLPDLGSNQGPMDFQSCVAKA